MPDGKKTPSTYIALCERVARLEVKMNILSFVAGATLVASLATLFRLLLG